MSDCVRIKVGFECSHAVNSDHEDIVEIPREEWESMTPEKQKAELDTIAEVELSNYVSSFAYVIGDDEE